MSDTQRTFTDGAFEHFMIWADWCEEQGDDPRARHLRELAQLMRDDPDKALEITTTAGNIIGNVKNPEDLPRYLVGHLEAVKQTEQVPVPGNWERWAIEQQIDDRWRITAPVGAVIPEIEGLRRRMRSQALEHLTTVAGDSHATHRFIWETYEDQRQRCTVIRLEMQYLIHPAIRNEPAQVIYPEAFRLMDVTT